MSDKSAAELERDADIARARVTDTADSIRSKMTPGQLMDEFTGLFAGGDLSSMANNLRTQVRDNPLPLTMVGAGLAWLMLGKGTSPESFSGLAGTIGTVGRGSSANESDDGYVAGAGGLVGETLSDTADSVISAASSATDGVIDAADRAKSTLSAAAESFGSGAGQAGRSVQDLFQREPLAVAAIGLVIGAAIGAMLPHTQTEDEKLGAYSKDIRDSAQQVFEKGVEQAKEVASEAYAAAKQEADRQGTGTDGADTLVGKIDKVVRSTVSKTDEAVRERLPDSGADSEQAS